MRVEFKYNNKESGPKVITYGDRPVLIYLYNLEGGVKTEVEYIPLPANHFYLFPRQWFTKWRIEVLEWVSGKLQTVAVDEFTPTFSSTHFYLEDGSLEEHLEYSKACLDYVEQYVIFDFKIESIYYKELAQYFGFDINQPHPFTDEIANPEDCYVNYVIKKTPSTGSTFENYNVPLVNEEGIFYNHHHPLSPTNLTPYEFAKSIVMGPDYKKINKFIPYSWSLQERNVY